MRGQEGLLLQLIYMKRYPCFVWDLGGVCIAEVLDCPNILAYLEKKV